MAIGVRELATAHLEAGLANSVNALVQLVGIVFGVAVGRSLVTSWLGTIPLNAPNSFPHGVDIAAAALVGLAFVVTLRARPAMRLGRAARPCLRSSPTSSPPKRWAKSPESLWRHLLVGLAGNAIARHFRRSPARLRRAGLLMLIPGTMGYWSASESRRGPNREGN